MKNILGKVSEFTYFLTNDEVTIMKQKPIMGSAYGPNQPLSQTVNREVFSLAWTESTVLVTGASKLRGPKRLSYSNWKVGCVGRDLITLFVLT